MLRLPDHADHKYDPTAGLIDPWSKIMGVPPTHIVWIKELSGNAGSTVFPYIAWTVAEPLWDGERDGICLWHGTRPDAALAIVHSEFKLVPGPRRQAEGRLQRNLDKTYVAEDVGLAAQYAAPPLVAGTSGDRTAACGAMVLFQCEPSTPERGEAVARVGKSYHPAKLSKPRVLQIMVRFAWRRCKTQDSRMYNLRQGFQNGDCAHAVHTAGVTDSAILAKAELMDGEARKGQGRSAQLMAQWPSPMDMCCPEHAQDWIKAQFEPALRALPPVQSLDSRGINPDPIIGLEDHILHGPWTRVPSPEHHAERRQRATSVPTARPRRGRSGTPPGATAAHKRRRCLSGGGTPTSSRQVFLLPTSAETTKSAKRGRPSTSPSPGALPEHQPDTTYNDVKREEHDVAYFVSAQNIKGQAEKVCAPGWPVWTSPPAEGIKEVHDGAYLPWGTVVLGRRCTDLQYTANGADWILLDVPCIDGVGHRTMWAAAGDHDEDTNSWCQVMIRASTSARHWIQRHSSDAQTAAATVFTTGTSWVTHVPPG